MRSEFQAAIAQLIAEKGLPREVVMETVATALLAAYHKSFGGGENVRIEEAERVIRATCLLDYPLDRLEIQVLDDSTDHSADIARQACEEWAARGFPVKYIHRDNREGYKAGALAEGRRVEWHAAVSVGDLV